MLSNVLDIWKHLLFNAMSSHGDKLREISIALLADIPIILQINRDTNFLIIK